MKSTAFLEMVLTAVLVVAALTAAPALAQEGPAAPAAQAAQAETGSDAAGTAEPAGPEGEPYRAPEALKAECNAEIAKDSLWEGTIRANIRRQYEDEWQTENASRLAKDNKFVVWAYAILWVILAGLVAFVFTRQKRLVDEIDRLRGEVKAAAAE